METGEAIQAELNGAIAAAVAKHENGFVLKWIALIETADADGTRGLWTNTSEDIKSWDAVGLLQHALHIQMAQTLRGDD